MRQSTVNVEWCNNKFKNKQKVDKQKRTEKFPHRSDNIIIANRYIGCVVLSIFSRNEMK